MPLRFAVLGDVHFTDARLHQNAMQGGDWPRSDLERYDLARRTYYDALIQEVRKAKPDFVVQLGDLLLGHWDRPEYSGEELGMALTWLERAKVLQSHQVPLVERRGRSRVCCRHIARTCSARRKMRHSHSES
jgi:3',5'-cyclic AMP phosphodiesterase CpdA